MSIYYVTRGLNHDGREFKRGDTIELIESAALSLAQAGVIQLEPLAGTEVASVTEPVPTAAPESADVATAGGEAMKTGEPSVDAPQTEEDGEDTAQDITPGAKSESPASVTEPVPTAAPTTHASRTRKPRHATPETPKHDPSANL